MSTVQKTWITSINSQRKLDDLLNPLSFFEWYKVLEFLRKVLLFFVKVTIFILVFAILEPLHDFRKILFLVKVVIIVMSWFEWNPLFFPLFFDSFDSHFKFNELLEVKVVATPSVSEPVDCWSFQEQTNEEQTDDVVVISKCFDLVSLVNANNEKPISICV